MASSLTKRKITEMHNVHETDVEIMTCFNTWGVRNFPYLMEACKVGTKIKTRTFKIPLASAADAPVTLWRLCCFPCGSDEHSRGFLTMGIMLVAADNPLKATVEMGICSASGEPLGNTVQVLKRKFFPDELHTIPRMIAHEQLLAGAADIFADEKLRLYYKISLVPQVEIL